MNQFNLKGIGKIKNDKKLTIPIRCNPDTYKNRIIPLKLKISNIEGRSISNDELIRRTFNIPDIEKALEKDAGLKRRLGNG